MNIRHADITDIGILSRYDRHISPEEMENLIHLGRVSIVEVDGQFAGWLRWNLFWDNTPFLNMLYLLEAYRGKGFGRELMNQWEAAMHHSGFVTVMTSTASDEYAQHFYQKLGYTTIGGFTPFEEPYELLLAKRLRNW